MDCPSVATSGASSPPGVHQVVATLGKWTARCFVFFVFFFIDVPVGWEKTEEERNFKLPHLHRCHWLIKGWREFCWKAEVKRLLKMICFFCPRAEKEWRCITELFLLAFFSRSNLMGTKFTVFDNALNPERALPDMSNARQELAGIIYVSYNLIQASSRAKIRLKRLQKKISGPRKQMCWEWKDPEEWQLSFQGWTRTMNVYLSDQEM